VSGRNWHAFRDVAPEDLPRPDLNPYLKLHRDWGPPVLTASQALDFKGRWAAAFDRDAPLHVEIGPGNGFHLAGMAKKHPEWNWLGIEIRYKRVICAKKIGAAGVGAQARICRYDAWWLDDLFDRGEIAGLYINHPDPWKKDADENKRLLSPFIAAWAARALRPGAPLRIKTDHRPNIDRMIESMAGLPLRLVRRTDDVRANGYPWPAEDDVVTNYESKFHKRDEPIFAMLAERVEGPALDSQHPARGSGPLAEEAPEATEGDDQA
jgi:tRNA (guanine-N7-)-methyltransferase